MKKCFSIILILVFAQNLMFCQSSGQYWQNKSLSLSHYYGYLIPEYSYHHLQATEAINGFSIGFGKTSSGNDFWQRLYNYPVSGLCLFHSGLSNAELYGHQTAIFAYTGSEFLSDKKLQLPWQFGLGMNYVSKRFDFQDNYHNIGVGSNLNVYFRGSFGWSFMIFEIFRFTQSLVFHHLSNANMNEPNIGLNWLTVSNTIAFYPKGKSVRLITDVPDFKKAVEHFIFLNGGLKHTVSFEPYKYMTGSLSYVAELGISHMVSLSLGADLFFDSSVEEEMIAKGIEFEHYFAWHSGVHVGLKMNYNKLGVGIQQGIYVGLLEHLNNNKMYNRAFAQWRFNDWFTAMIALKSHLHILDHVEIGIGYRLFKSNCRE